MLDAFLSSSDQKWLKDKVDGGTDESCGYLDIDGVKPNETFPDTKSTLQKTKKNKKHYKQ